MNMLTTPDSDRSICASNVLAEFQPPVMPDARSGRGGSKTLGPLALATRGFQKNAGGLRSIRISLTRSGCSTRPRRLSAASMSSCLGCPNASR